MLTVSLMLIVAGWFLTFLSGAQLRQYSLAEALEKWDDAVYERMRFFLFAVPAAVFSIAGVWLLARL